MAKQTGEVLRKVMGENYAARFEKLPAWARHALEQLARTVAEDNALATVVQGPADTDTTVDLVTRKMALPAGTTVCFRLGGEQDVVRVRVDRDHEGYILNVNASKSIAVEPWATNLVHVRTKRR